MRDFLKSSFPNVKLIFEVKKKWLYGPFIGIDLFLFDEFKLLNFKVQILLKISCYHYILLVIRTTKAVVHSLPAFWIS